MRSLAQKKLNDFLFWAGALAVLLAALPYVLLGQDAIFTYHDQLDGEVIAYLLQAKHLFDENLPEFLGGAAKTALVPPAPACVLLFLGGNAFRALVFMQIAESLTGYVGMYLLVKRQTKRVLPAVITAVLYGYLPFLPVYGLAQYGLPLLLYLVLEAAEGRKKKTALLYAGVFALNSSLVLVGFAVLGTLALWICWNAVRKNGKTVPLLEMEGVLLFCYIAENISLITQTLGVGKGTEVSHKSDYILSAESFGTGFLKALFRGGQHSEDYHSVFLWAAALGAAAGVIWLWRRKTSKETGKTVANSRIGTLVITMGVSFGFNVLFALTAALWNAQPGVFLRSHLQALGAFQLDRFLWLAPCFWYLILGCAMALWAELWQAQKGQTSLKFSRFLKPFCASILLLAMVFAVSLTGVQVLLGSHLKPNVQKLRNPSYAAISFNDYYGVGVLSRVEDFLWEQTGQTQEEYRVVSLGIDPAAALYHGFYCLDGYSNNYSLEYKRAFRRIIAPELEKSDYLKDYFDQWGNRCYLLSAECPGYYTIEKGGFFFADYSLDKEALKEMGGDYLFSAAYIANWEELGLTLLREEPFATEDSYYQIYVYGL